MADTVSVTDSILKTVGGVALSAAETALIAEAPWLGLPVVKQVWQFIASQLAAKVIEELQKGANVLIIDFQTTAEASKAKTASDQLFAVQGDPKSTDAEKQKAEDDFKSAYAELIGFRNPT